MEQGRIFKKHQTDFHQLLPPVPQRQGPLLERLLWDVLLSRQSADVRTASRALDMRLLLTGCQQEISERGFEETGVKRQVTASV